MKLSSIRPGSEIEPDRKIVFHWDYGGEDHVVAITLAEQDDGSTVVEVNEDGFQEDNDQRIDLLLSSKGGWVYALTCLKGYLEFGVTRLRAGLA